MGAVQNYVTVSRRPPDIEDYIDMLRRHRSWIIGPTYAGLVIAVVVAFFWPDTFESQAVLRVTPQMVSERVVPDTQDMALGQLLDGLRTKILSRTSLTALISDSKLKLYPRLVQRYPIEDAIAKMQQDVTITSSGLGAAANGRVQAAFTVKFRYPDKYKAKQVVEYLVTAFMDQNTVVQSQAASETKSFLSDQLKDANDRLQTIQTNITKFREENAGRLPDNAIYNSQNLSTLENRVSASDERVNGLNLERRNLELSLDSSQQVLGFMNSDVQQAAPAQARVNEEVSNLDRQIQAEKAALAVMRVSYRDTYPDIKAQEAKIASLETQKQQTVKQEQQEQQAQDAKPAAKPDQPNKGLSVQQQANVAGQKDRIKYIQTQIENIDAEIKRAADGKADLEKQIVAVRAKIEASPEVEQQYNTLNQDLMLAKANYDDVSHRERESETTQDLQERHLGEQLEVLDSASLPSNPVEPNRWAISGIGVAMGMLLGLVMAGAKEAKDSSLKNLKDVRAYTNLPVLSSIPLLENALLVRRKRRLFWLAWSTAIIAGSAAMFIAMTYYMSGPKGQ